MNCQHQTSLSEFSRAVRTRQSTSSNIGSAESSSFRTDYTEGNIARLTTPIETNSQIPQKSRILFHRFKMSVQLPPATHRKRALPQGELEAASTLKLGADQNTHTLSLSEARLVINKVLENKRRGGKKYEEPE